MNEINFTPSKNVTYSEAAQAIPNDNAMDLMHYYRLMMRSLWKIIMFSLFVGGFSVFYALSLPPVYFAKTTLLIEAQRANVVSFEDVYQVDTRGRSYLKTQLEIFKSRAIAGRVVDRMRLIEHPLYAPSEVDQSSKFSINSAKKLLSSLISDDDDTSIENSVSDEAVVVESSESELLEAGAGAEPDEGNSYLRKRIIDQVMRSLVIVPIYGTKLIRIQVAAGEPQLAADIANEFAEVYIESHLEAKLEVTQKASAWLSDRLGSLRQTLRESEQVLQNFREREQLIDTGDVRSIDVAELEQLTQSLVEATRTKNDARALYNQISQSKLSVDRMLALPVVSNNSLVQNLIESRATAKRLVAELGDRYGKKHPRMVSALSDLSQVEGELKTQVDNVARGLNASYLAAQDAERELRRQITNVKSRLQNVSRKEFSLRELEREVDANRQVYEVFLNRGKETNETSSLEAVNARVIDEALPPDFPSKPEKKKIVMAAVFLSAFFAVGIILLLDWLDNTIKTPEDVEERLRVPLLGYLPLDKSNKDESPFLGFLSDEKWHFAEAVRTIRTSFVLSCLDKPAKVTVITSTVPNEGKSTVSLCLAHALGQMEKVLLIDADMRKPSIGKALDISLLTPGLSNLIAGTAGLEECVTRLPNSEVDIITAGVVLGNPLDLIAGDRFSLVLNSLKEKYDRILIDSAPIQAVSDSLVIATHADALIYVVRSDGSSTPLIKKGLRRLSGTQARFSGVVLNQVDVEKVKKQSGYESEYYDNYGYAYGENNA
jgi:capsular exopolysaccharide synthesis family protein